MPLPADKDPTITSFKGFDKTLSCRGHQFEIGKTYEVSGEIIACENGFHACEYPLDVFNYYPPGESRFATVKQSGQIARHSGDTKIASAKITIDAEIHVPEIVAKAIKWVIDQTTPANAKHAEGYQSAASSTGYQSAASSTGYRSAASSTGYRSAASSTGDRSAASSTGYRSAASSTGYRSAAMSAGYQGRVMGEKDGTALFLVYRDGDYDIKHAWAGIVGRDGVKPNVWYTLNSDGKPVEA